MPSTCSNCGRSGPPEQSAYRNATCACGAFLVHDTIDDNLRVPRCGTCDCAMRVDDAGAWRCPWCNPAPVLAARPVPIVGTASELPAGLSLTTRGWISRRKRELRELTRFTQDDSKTVATFLVGLVTLLFLAAAWLG